MAAPTKAIDWMSQIQSMSGQASSSITSSGISSSLVPSTYTIPNTWTTTTTAPWPNQTYASTSISSALMPGQMPGLPLKDAHDMMTQYDHDGILVKDKVLLFGCHTSKGLRCLPLEYIVGLNKAVRTLRRELLMEVRRRRVVERLPKK